MFLIVLSVLSTYGTKVDACTHPPDELFETEIINFDTSFRFDRHDDLHKSTLYIVYEWRILKSTDSSFDGYLYKVLDRDSNYNPVTGKIEGLSELEYDPNACDGLNNTLIARKNDSVPVYCNIPCEKYFPPICNYSKVCSLLKLNYSLLSPDKRRLEVPIQFGRVYDFHLMIYKNWHTGSSRVLEGSEVVRYCKDELISYQNISHRTAEDFCSDKMEFSKSALASGPPSHFEKYKVIKNLTTNRAELSFRWKIPLDISPNVTLAGFDVFSRHGDVIIDYSNSFNLSNSSKDHYFSATITRGKLGASSWLIVTPFLKKNNCTQFCYEYGLSVKEYWKIEDINACKSDGGLGPYCSESASCLDLPSENTTSAICTCPDGYAGNGISTSFYEGTSCYDDYDACSLEGENSVCDPVAVCTDSPPPKRSATCRCPEHYNGDGFRAGSGCSERAFVVGIAVGIPMGLIILFLVGWLIWKTRAAKNKGIPFQCENL